ncbi:MAG: DUF1080 domain-containing protein [Acidobacteriota bacterium]|nr:DUF1080 domain-containing protein [Acidobacteriota bacterium]
MKSALLLFLFAVPSIAQDLPNRLTPAEKKEGWRLLFDGDSLKGWEALPTSNSKTNGEWKVESGAILCPGTSAGWLASADSFADFHLKLQFRGAEKVNSGVFLHSERQGQPHITGYELQIWDYQPAGYNTGSLVNTMKAPPTKIRADQWNDYDITVTGDHFLIVLNGEKLLDTRDSAHTSGLIGFQCQPNNRIEFRSIRVLTGKP